MSSNTIELPLFPLNMVLFPGTVRPLHVFEPRYRQMVKDCLREDKLFGIVLLKEEAEGTHEEPYTVGTIAEIHNLNKLENGCYNLMAVGTKRFRIVSQHHEKPYLSGLVEPFTDAPEPDELLDRYTVHLRRLFTTYLDMLLETTDGKEVEAHLPAAPEDLSHFIAYILDMDDIYKQRYLELTSTLERVRDEIDFLRREIPFMRQMLFKEPPKERIMLN